MSIVDDNRARRELLTFATQWVCAEAERVRDACATVQGKVELRREQSAALRRGLGAPGDGERTHRMGRS